MAPYVLIVDDDRDAREILRLVLRYADIQTDEAANGPEALQKIALNCPQVIVLDMMMPGMTGAEVAEQLWRAPDLRHIPIIMFSGYGGDLSLHYPNIVDSFSKGQLSFMSLRDAIQQQIAASDHRRVSGLAVN